MSKEPRKFYENEIKELHNSILEISKSCFEYKKLCVTTIGIFLGLMLNSIGKHTLFTLENITLAIISITFLITLIFHIADGISYYFQRINRQRQNTYKNLLNIKDKNILINKIHVTYHLSLINLSMVLYFTIYLILLITSYILHNIYIKSYFLELSLGILTTLFILFRVAALYDKFLFNKKIFICYTEKDANIINKESLKTFKQECNSNKLYTYIDLLDNKQINIQDNVYLNLLNSNLFVILKTNNIQRSFWAKHEYKIAQSLNMQIKEINLENLNSNEWIQQAVNEMKPK